MVKDFLSPGLRGMGFTGSGGRYSLASPECWALVSLQKSAYSDAAVIKFTVNLLVANKADWLAARVARPYLPERPSAGTQYEKPAVSQRIGILTPDHLDKWWRVSFAVDLEAVSNEVLRDIRECGLPWLRQQLHERP